MKALDADVLVYLWQGSMDMRKSFDRLSEFVSEHFDGKPVGRNVYVFFSRCRSRVKLLYWDRDGYAIWHKRLEAGSYKVAKVEGHEVITALDLSELLSGTEFSRIQFRKSAEKSLYS